MITSSLATLHSLILCSISDHYYVDFKNTNISLNVLIFCEIFIPPLETFFGPEKFGPRIKKSCDDFHAGTKFLGDQKSQGPK